MQYQKKDNIYENICTFSKCFKNLQNVRSSKLQETTLMNISYIY